MDDGDDAWSAEPDESFRTPRLDSAASFDSLETPTAMDQEPTPQQSSYSRGPSSDRLDGDNDTDGVASGLVRTLPRLNLEAAIDADAGTTHAQQVNGNGDNSRHSDEESEPGTARPVLSSRASSFSQMSPDLHILASMYRPDEAQLTVADSAGTSFENISLATPTMEYFGHQNQWGDTESNNKKGKGKGRETFSWSSRRGSEHADTAQHASRPELGKQHSSGKGFGHRKTASDASHMVMEPNTTVAGNPKRASWMSNASAFASTPSFTHEPEIFHADIDIENYRPRASSSSSSVADSVGTAGEAPDSDYEDARSKSHSRQGSRRPSISDVPVITKRLSSFAPIPSLKATPSQTDLSSAGVENGQSESSTFERKPQRQDTDATVEEDNHMSRGSSAQSASSSGSGSSIGGAQSAPASRTPSNGATTYSVPMTVTNSQSFEQHRKENEKWLKKKGKKARPSPLDKVISKTRPHDLPPKEREEDKKHLKEFEVMMLASKQAAKKKETVRQEKRRAKEIAATQALHTWEKEILPNWKSVLRKDELRQVWWGGTMPPRYRARFWQSCIGNSLVLGKTSYAKALALARSLQGNGKFPPEITAEIEADVKHILPSMKLFQEGCPLHTDIIELLQAHCVFWQNDKPVYRSGTSYIAGMLLVCMPAQEAFLCLVNLVNKSLLKTFYYGTQEDIQAYYRVFNTLLADQMPTVYRNFVSHDIRPSLYLQDWLTTLFSQHLGLDSATRAWDIYVLEGDQFLFRLALGLLQILKARLFNPDHEELTELFQGRDKGAKAIVARETNKPESEVEPWEAYEEMGATEEPVFDVVRSLEWKEATFQRLLARELPDDG